MRRTVWVAGGLLTVLSSFVAGSELENALYQDSIGGLWIPHWQSGSGDPAEVRPGDGWAQIDCELPLRAGSDLGIEELGCWERQDELGPHELRRELMDLAAAAEYDVTMWDCDGGLGDWRPQDHESCLVRGMGDDEVVLYVQRVTDADMAKRLYERDPLSKGANGTHLTVSRVPGWSD